MSGSLDATVGASIGGGGNLMQTPLLGRVLDPNAALRNYNSGLASNFAPQQAEANVGLTKAQTVETLAKPALYSAQAQLYGAQAGVAGIGLQVKQQQLAAALGQSQNGSTSYQPGSGAMPWESGGGREGSPGTPGGPTGASLVSTVQPQGNPAAPAPNGGQNANAPPAIGATTPPPADATPPAPAIGSGATVASGPPPGPSGSVAPGGVGVYATESQPVSPTEVAQATPPPGTTPTPRPPQPSGGQPSRTGPPLSGALTGQPPPGMAPVFTGPEGSISPLVGFAVPKQLSIGLLGAQDQGAEREKLWTLKQHVIASAIQQTINPQTGQADPAMWDQQVQTLFNQGWITNQDVKRAWGNPGLAMQMLTGTMAPGDTPAMQAAVEAGKKQAGVGPALQVKAGETAIEGANTIVHVTVPSADGTSSVDTQMTRNQAIQRGILKPDGSNGTGSVVQGQGATDTPMTGAAFGLKMPGQENNTGNPGALNQSGPGGTATSSAMGNAQFLKDTWLDVMKRNRPDLTQGKTDDQILALRDDRVAAAAGAPGLSAQMTTQYAKENSAALSAAGIPVNATTLAMAHGFGPGGAKALLNSPADASASYVLGSQITDANPNLRGKTVADVVGGFKNRWHLGPVQFDEPAGAGGVKVAGPGGGPATPPPPTGNDVLAGGGAGGGATAPNAGTVPPQPGEVGRTTPVPSETTKLQMTNDQTQMNKDTESVADMQSGAQHSAAAQAILYDLRERLKRAPGTTGAMGDTRTEVANYLKTFAPDWANKFVSATTGLDPNKAGDMQTIIKEALTATTGAETTLLPGARYGAMLTNYFSKAMPSINTQGPAFKEMMNWQLIGHQMVKDHAGFVQDDNDAQRANFQGDMVHNRYQTLNASQQKWMDPQGVHIPEVYQAASDALNKRPYDQWSKGLNAAQLGEVGQIIKRVDPTQGGLLNSHGDWIPISRVPAHAW